VSEGAPENSKASRRFRRGASILPSLFTTGNLFLGFWAIIRSLHGQYAEAASLIGGAIVLDTLDGQIARLTGTTSEFGGELDSLADAISFGVAPALLAYQWAFTPVPRVGWLAAFLLVVCGVLRLARFNVQRHVTDARFFVGLPIPAAAGQIAAIVYFWPEPVRDRPQAILLVAAVVGLAFLMVSTLRYRSFKGIDLRRRRSYINVLGIALLFVLIAQHPEHSLLALASLYTLSGPTAYLVGLLRRRGDPPRTVAADPAR
jgi:CDP-diacylglycerol--serine O-phosphatidyltransferase